MTCHNISGAFQHCDVNVGWYPCVATCATEVRSKPGAGLLLAVLAAGEGFARQSVRNPSCKPNPAPRAAVTGNDGHLYVWGYRRAGAKTGWVRADHIAPDQNAARKREANGPAREDFEVGRSVPTPGTRSGCGKVSLSKPRMVVTAREAHLRYSPHGTGVHYLHAGDVVTVLIANGPQGNHFVHVVKAAPDGSARPGMRGWVSTSALERVTA
jgi:hypothetical protein